MRHSCCKRPGMHFKAMVVYYYLFFRYVPPPPFFYDVHCETDNIVCSRSLKRTRCAVASGNAHQEHSLVTVNTPETTVKMKHWS